jgi:hypothetical protein
MPGSRLAECLSSPNILECVTITHGRQDMDETAKSPAPESSDSRRWIGRILMAVVLGEAIWSLLVSITNNLALPAMARVVGGDAQSPLYLGKGDFNVPALFAAVLEVCFAGIVAVFLGAWSQRSGRTQARPVRLAPVAAPLSAAVVRPPPESRPTPVMTEPAIEATLPVTSAAPAPPSERRTAQPVKPGKPKPAKQVYYNIVGEPVETDEE